MKKPHILIFLILALALACSQPSAPKKKSPPLFIWSAEYPVGKEPSFLITEDFDKDSNLDLVVTNSGEHTFSYLKGNKDGTFQDALTFKTGTDPICVVAADFNRDGFPDLAVLNYGDQNIHIYLNTKTGSFRNTGVMVKPGKIPINLTAGDFNEDGFPDLAVSMRYHKVIVMAGKGDGTFTEMRSMPVQGQPTGLVVGDYNHDGHLDIAVALAGSGNVGVEILWGKGKGVLEASKRFKGGRQPLTIANIDANGDGFPDLITSTNSSHAVTVLLNNKDGTFKTLKDFASGDFPKFIAVADFSGDGIPDIAVSNSSSDLVSVSIGNGDGTFVYPPVFQGVPGYPQGIVAGDFNHDDLIDLALSSRDRNSISVLLKKNMVNPLPDKPQG